MTVVKPGPEYNAVTVNELGEHCYASPAISQGQLLIRAKTICIASERDHSGKPAGRIVW